MKLCLLDLGPGPTDVLAVTQTKYVVYFFRLCRRTDNLFPSTVKKLQRYEESVSCLFFTLVCFTDSISVSQIRQFVGLFLICLSVFTLSVYQSVRPSVLLLLSLCQFFHYGLSLHSGSSGSRSENSRKKKLSSKSVLLIPTVSPIAFHSAKLFLFSRHHIPTNSVNPFSAYQPTHNPQLFQSTFLSLLVSFINFSRCFFLNLAAWWFVRWISLLSTVFDAIIGK